MKKIVYKNDGSTPVDDILCTTYQMRNFYLQFRDGFFSDLDFMNYVQHYKAVKMMKGDMTVLDVCCGRSLLLPLIRYYTKDIKKYIGVDIKKENIRLNVDIRNGKAIDPKKHYPFDVEFVISNVAEMSDKIKDKIDFVVYTSAIEHMHKDHGEKSLNECSSVMKRGAKIFLSCPNTPENQDGYDVRYKAHVYEWKISELEDELRKNKFKILKKIGLIGKSSDFKNAIKKMPTVLQKYFNEIIDYMPREFLTSFLYVPFPELSTEVLIIAERL